MKNCAVFLQTGFRTGGTWLWGRFRDLAEVTAFCEPLNELLEGITLDELQRLTPETSNLNHSILKAPYFDEYRAFIDTDNRGIKGYRAAFGLQSYFDSPVEQPRELAAYISQLIACAQEREKSPVLKFTRALGRADWLRQTFPEARQILLTRHPWSQFQSGWELSKRHNDFTFLMAPLFTVSRPHTGALKRLCEEFGIPHVPFSEGFAKCSGAYYELARTLPLQALFGAFVGMFAASYAVSSRFADLIVSYETLIHDASYSNEVTNQIQALTGLTADFSTGRFDQRTFNHLAPKWALDAAELSLKILEVEYAEAAAVTRGLLTGLGGDMTPAVPSAQLVAREGQLVQALLDLDLTHRDLTARYWESEADRAARLENISKLEKLLADERASHAAYIAAQATGIEEITSANHELRAQVAQRDEQINTLTELYKASEADSAARLKNVAALEQLLAEQQAAHAASDAAQAIGIAELTLAVSDLRKHLEQRDEQMLALTKLYQESEADRSARLENLLKMDQMYADQSKQLAEAEANLQDKARENSSLAGQLAIREAQLDLQAGNLRELAQSFERARRRHSLEAAASRSANRDLQEETVRQWGAIELQGRQLATLESLLGRLKSSYVFRLMRRAHLWGWLDEEPLETAVSKSETGRRTPRKVVVDLTPVLPGGGNGGAKVMTLELIRHLGRLAPECGFILLTAAVSHDELATLDAANIRRLCVQNIAKGLEELGNPGRPGESLVRRLGADMLFCPFTAPYYFDPSVPTVSVVYDLQYAYYPQFFDSSEIQERDRNIRTAVAAASAVVCISDHVMATLLEKMTVSADRLETIHVTVPRRLGRPSSSQCESVLKTLGLTEDSFLLYPANFWPHKNHEILLTAFGIYLANHPGSGIKLVLTGSSGPRKEFLQDAVRRMDLAGSVFFPGYLQEEELSALLHSCLALIFPSLFEGFGMPLLEAMSAGRPVLCSNSTSLPEVAGDAAIYFDPRIPGEIADAIARIASEPDLRQDLSARAEKRLALFGGPEKMAASYLKTFQRAIERPLEAPSGVYGVFEDGWLSERFTVAYGSGEAPRKIRVELASPEWSPVPALSVRAESGQRDALQYSLLRGETLVIEHASGQAPGSFEISCAPSFQPYLCGLGDDRRILTCQLKSADVSGPNGSLESLRRFHHGA
jgi:glycosyltransferase involved in cell wall biosynthesis